MKDHSNLMFRIPQELSKAHAQRANPVIIKDHFDKLQQVFKKIHLQQIGFGIRMKLDSLSYLPWRKSSLKNVGIATRTCIRIVCVSRVWLICTVCVTQYKHCSLSQTAHTSNPTDQTKISEHYLVDSHCHLVDEVFIVTNVCKQALVSIQVELQ
jgi:hypothetical protein